jgi:hypothetical protein
MEIMDSTLITDEAGNTFRVDITPDDDTCPGEFDCYDEHDMEEYRVGNWRYVGVIVTPVVGGVAFEGESVSMWGVEYGRNGDSWYVGMDEITGEHPVPDMCAEVLGNVRRTAPAMIRDLSRIYDS